MTDNQNDKQNKKNAAVNKVTATELGCFYSYVKPAGRKRSLRASWFSWSMTQYGLISVRTALNGNTHTLLFHRYDLRATRRAQTSAVLPL